MSPDTLNIAAALVCLAYLLAFEHLGNWRHVLSIVLLLLCAIAVGILLALGMYRYAEAPMVAFVLLLGHCLWELGKWLVCEGRYRLRGHKRASLPARRHKKASIPFTLSNAELTTRFSALAAKDELAVVKPALNFLSWNNGEDYILQLHLLPQGGWVCIFWSPSDFELRDKEVKAACKAAGVPCHKHLLGMRTQGIAICQRGQITLAPADQLVHFDEFLHTILAPQEEFTGWLQDYHPKKA